MARFPRSRRRLAGLALVLATAAGVRAHDLATDITVQMFVRQEGRELRILMRVPTPLLSDANLPTIDGYVLDLNAIEAPLRLVAANIAARLELRENDQSPAPPRTSWIVSELTDGAFATYETALAHLNDARPMADADFYWLEGAVDFQLTYDVSGAAGARYSLRLNDFRSPNLPVRTVLRYKRADEAERTLDITRPSERVSLDPTLREAVAYSAKLGVRRLVVGELHLLLILCLAIPRRRLRAALASFAVFVAGHIVAIAIAAAAGDRLDPGVLLGLGILAAAMLVTAALQNFLPVRFKWIALVCLLFGLLDGLSFGLTYREASGFAGTHTAASLAAFALPIELGMLWLLLVLQPAVGLVFRSVGYRRLTTIILSVFPIHQGLQAILENSSALTQLDASVTSPLVLALARHWLLVLLTAGFGLWLIARLTAGAGAKPMANASLSR